MPLVPGDGILSQGQRSCCDFRFVYTALMASIATQYTVDITFRKYRAKARHRSLHAETSEVVSCSAHREIIGTYQSLLIRLPAWRLWRLWLRGSNRHARDVDTRICCRHAVWPQRAGVDRLEGRIRDLLQELDPARATFLLYLRYPCIRRRACARMLPATATLLTVTEAS